MVVCPHCQCPSIGPLADEFRLRRGEVTCSLCGQVSFRDQRPTKVTLPLRLAVAYLCTFWLPLVPLGGLPLFVGPPVVTLALHVWNIAIQKRRPLLRDRPSRDPRAVAGPFRILAALVGMGCVATILFTRLIGVYDRETFIVVAVGMSLMSIALLYAAIVGRSPIPGDAKVVERGNGAI
jgi:hypothetical protein